MWFPLYITWCFSFSAFSMFSMCLLLLLWLVYVLACLFLGFSCIEFSVPLRLHYFFTHIMEVFDHNLFKNILRYFVFLFFWDLYNLNVGTFNIFFLRSLRLPSILFIPFPLLGLQQSYPLFYLLGHESIFLSQLFYYWLLLEYFSALPGDSVQKRICLHSRRPGSNTWVRKIPWERKWYPSQIFLPGKSHKQRSLVG